MSNGSKIFFSGLGVRGILDSTTDVVTDNKGWACEACERKRTRFDSHVVTRLQRLRALVDSDRFLTYRAVSCSTEPGLKAGVVECVSPGIAMAGCNCFSIIYTR